VNPNTQALERWAESNGVTGEFATICEDPKAREFILGELTKMGKEKKVIRLKPKTSFSIYFE
jgi:long-chain acyl-CoA synthetase